MSKKYYRYELQLNPSQEQWLKHNIHIYQSIYDGCVRSMRKRQSALYEQKRYHNANKQEQARMGQQRRY